MRLSVVRSPFLTLSSHHNPSPHLGEEVSAEVVRLGGDFSVYDVLLHGEYLDDGLQIPKRLVCRHDCLLQSVVVVGGREGREA